jgi:hypothetical protein
VEQVTGTPPPRLLYKRRGGRRMKAVGKRSPSADKLRGVSPISGNGAPHCTRNLKSEDIGGAASRVWTRSGPWRGRGCRMWRSTMEGGQVAGSQRVQSPGRVIPVASANPSPGWEADSKIENFFGQLWEILNLQPRRERFHTTLFWVRWDVWDSRKVRVHDLHLVQASDIMRPDPKQSNFAEICGEGGRKSYRQALIGEMARRGRGYGRGSGGIFEEEQWGSDPGWWNPCFCSFPPPQFPPHCGFFPCHPLFHLAVPTTTTPPSSLGSTSESSVWESESKP